MAVNILSADSTSQWTANTAGDTYVLQEDVYLSVLGTAISGTSAVTGRKFQIDGHVIADGGGTGLFVGQDATNGGSSTILIGDSGSVLGETFGVVSYGGDLTMLNRGEVSGGTAGLYISGASNNLLNEGDIVSSGGTALNSQGEDALIENYGSITGDTCGVLLAGDASTLINHGSISAKDDASSSNAITLSGGDAAFVNFGTVSGQGGRVILGSDSDSGEGVVNHGLILGYVDLGDGDDAFYNDGGSVFGIVDLGDGSDIFSNKNGFFSSSVTGGNGNDEYFIYDDVTEISEDFDAGEDTVNAFVSHTLGVNFENLVLKGQADINGRGNLQDNDIWGNAGDNRLFGGAGEDRFRAGTGNDLYDGGKGVDELNYYGSALASGVIVNLTSGKGGGAAAGHTYRGIEDVVGTDFKDRLIGNGKANDLTGDEGNDILTGGGGKDVFLFTGASGTDTVTDFQDGQDKIHVGYQVNGFDPNSFSEVKPFLVQKGNDVVIDFSSTNAGDKMILKNTDVEDLSAADFQF